MKATPPKPPAKASKAPAKKAAKPATPAGAIAPLPPHLAPKEKKKNPGVAHVPTDQIRALVALCMFANMTHEQAAAVVGIAKHTLEKHYAAELTDGKAKMLARVVNNLYSNATQTRDMKAANTAAIFILKQHGWRDDGMNAQIKATQTASDGTEQVMTFTLKIGERGEG
jgi:predicted DNA-binding protein (UPF0251 family)